MDKIALFIDGGYLAKILRNEFDSAKIDFQKLQELISAGNTLFRSYYYICPAYRSDPPTDQEKLVHANQTRFFDKLKLIPHFEIKFGILVKRDISCDRCGHTTIKFEQKRIDVLFAVDFVRSAWNKSIQRAAIIAGDGDFAPVVKDAKDAGVMVNLFYSKNSIARELHDVCDERYIIDRNFIEKIRQTPVYSPGIFLNEQ
jgi:uncharacterized LabA/DUF88 family protein